MTNIKRPLAIIKMLIVSKPWYSNIAKLFNLSFPYFNPDCNIATIILLQGSTLTIVYINDDVPDFHGWRMAKTIAV